MPTSDAICRLGVQENKKDRLSMELFSIPIYEKAPKYGISDRNGIIEDNKNEPYYFVKVLFYIPDFIGRKEEI